MDGGLFGGGSELIGEIIAEIGESDPRWEPLTPSHYKTAFTRRHWRGVCLADWRKVPLERVTFDGATLAQTPSDILITLFARDDITKHPDLCLTVKNEICRRGLYVVAVQAINYGTRRYDAECAVNPSVPTLLQPQPQPQPKLKCACCGTAVTSMPEHMDECPGMVRLYVRPNPYVVGPPPDQATRETVLTPCAHCGVKTDDIFTHVKTCARANEARQAADKVAKAIDCPALGAACGVPLDHNFHERLMPHRGAPIRDKE